MHGSVAIVPATRSWPECNSALHQTSKAQVFTEVHVTRPIQESYEHGVDYVTVALSIRFEVSDLRGVAVVAGPMHMLGVIVCTIQTTASGHLNMKAACS